MIPNREGDSRLIFSGARPYSLRNICHSWTVDGLRYEGGPTEHIPTAWKTSDLRFMLPYQLGPMRQCPLMVEPQ